MKASDVFPATWGTTRVAELMVPGEDDAPLALPDWAELMFPGEGGSYHHGTQGSVPPETLVLCAGDDVVALAEVVPLYLGNLYADDAEYFLAVRLRDIVNAEAWRRLPWSAFAPPTVVYAIDKFHDSTWVRLPEVACTMSYGGGWDDLQDVADREQPPASRVAPWLDRTVPPSDGALLRAVARGEAERLRAMLERGGSLLAGDEAPNVRNGLTMGASFAHHAGLLITAVMEGTVEVLEVLLAAGAPVDHHGAGSWSALQAAVANRRLGHLEVLLRHGADPRLRINGLDATDYARRNAPELVEQLTSRR